MKNSARSAAKLSSLPAPGTFGRVIRRLNSFGGKITNPVRSRYATGSKT